jgi:ectoine hydroxylase-related dioxygenase (phytanoyl-CoA dioxygenase family)
MPDIDDLLESGEARAASFDVNPGDVLFFDARIIHGSKGNTGDSRGARVALRFGGDDCVYFERPGETAIPTSDVVHACVHGESLSTDPHGAFPRVWPRV